jgi:hypothetical protein
MINTDEKGDGRVKEWNDGMLEGWKNRKVMA